MTQAPLISVVTVVRNGERTLARAMQSVAKQTYRNVQYIVVDGNSTDSTPQIIQLHRDHVDVLIQEPDRGIYDAFNKGLRLAQGLYVCILNCDDHLEPHALERLVQSIPQGATQDALPIIHANLKLLTMDGQPIRVLRHRADAFARRFSAMPVNHPSTFVPRVVYQKLGVFDDSYRIAGDYEFVLRVHRAGVSFMYLDEELVSMQVGGASSLKQSGVLAKERFRVIRTHGAGLLMATLFYLADVSMFSLRKAKRMVVPSKYEPT